MAHHKLSFNTRLKDLTPSIMFKLRTFFDANEKWKELASVILDRRGNEKYTADDIVNFELEFMRGKSPTQALIQDWSYDNASVMNFLKALIKIMRYDVLSWMLVEQMKKMNMEEFEERTDEGWDGYFETIKKMGESQAVVSFAFQIESGQNYTDGNVERPAQMRREVTTELLKIGTHWYTYENLSYLTDNWNNDLFKDGGRFLGSGGYADVFLGKPANSREIAVKRLKHKDNAEKQFQVEVDVLVSFEHPNIVPLFGISQDGPYNCIVYEFMENGTLEDRLECKDQSPPLTSAQRCRIAKGIAEGLNYLHTKGSVAIIHRDIKSANILLDYDFSAKISDYGLVHSGPSSSLMSHTVTSNLIGTRVYCAPEYMQHGEISEKLDAYSFGVVLYEMVTGLPAYDETRSSKSLSSYVREHCHGKLEDTQYIAQLVDVRMSRWREENLQKVFDMAYRLTAAEKYERPRVRDVVSEIMAWPQEW